MSRAGIERDCPSHCCRIRSSSAVFVLTQSAAQARRVALVIGQNAYPGGTTASIGLASTRQSRAPQQLFRTTSALKLELGCLVEVPPEHINLRRMCWLDPNRSATPKGPDYPRAWLWRRVRRRRFCPEDAVGGLIDTSELARSFQGKRHAPEAAALPRRGTRCWAAHAHWQSVEPNRAR